MEGRRPTGVLVALTNCDDEKQEKDFNRWYNEEHVVHCVGTGGYYTATRYEKIGPHPWEGKFLALYETGWTDPAAADRMLMHDIRNKPEKFPIHPALSGVLHAVFRYIGPREHWAGAPWTRPAKKTKGLLMLFVQCTDPAREDEFNEWYNSIHIHDVEDSPGVIAGHRFVNCDEKDAERKYLILYELDNEDAPGTFAKIVERLGSAPEPPGVLAGAPRQIDFMKVNGLACFKRLQ